MLVQCIHIKILPNQQQQRLIAKIKMCSSVVVSYNLHLIVVPVKEFWLIDPWWIAKLRNQIFVLNLKIPSVSCPLDHFVPVGVEQPNDSYAVSSASLNFQRQGQNPIRFIGGVHWLGACVFSRMRILGNKERNQCTKQLRSQNGEDVNQLLLKFQSLRMGSCGVILFLFYPCYKFKNARSVYPHKNSTKPTTTAVDRKIQNMLLSCWE